MYMKNIYVKKKKVRDLLTVHLTELKIHEPIINFSV